MRRLSPWRLGLLLAAVTGSAHAYTYPEHQLVSARAVTWIGESRQGARELFELVRRVLPYRRLCPGEGLWDPKGQLCFGLADLPALSGDHSANPTTLVERWFASPSDCISYTLPNAVAGITGFGRSWAPASECLHDTATTRLCVSRALQAFRQHDLTQPGTSHDTFQLDDQLLAADGQYLCLAERNRVHFRVPTLLPLDAAVSDTENAVAAYVQYHGEALALAALAATEPGSRRREHALGMAVLLELYSLHFLEDSTAAGHMVTPVEILNLASVNETHDYYNAQGVASALDHSVCQRTDLLSEARRERLQTACSAPNQTARVTGRIRGDRAIADGATADDAEDLTEAVAEVAVATSLNELVLASQLVPLDARALTGPRCPSALEACLQPNADGLAAVRSCEAAWTKLDRGELVRLVGAIYQRGWLAAVPTLPMVTEIAPPRQRMAGYVLPYVSLAGGVPFLRDSATEVTRELAGKGSGSWSLAAGAGWISPPQAMKLTVGAALRYTYGTPSTGSGVYEVGPSLGLFVSFNWGRRSTWRYFASQAAFAVGGGRRGDSSSAGVPDRLATTFELLPIGFDLVETDSSLFRVFLRSGATLGKGGDAGYFVGVLADAPIGFR